MQKLHLLATIICACPTLLFLWACITTKAGLSFTLLTCSSIFFICFGIYLMGFIAIRTAILKKQGNYHKTEGLFCYLQGLNCEIPLNADFEIVINDTFLELKHLKLKPFGRDIILQTYQVNLSDILELELITKEELRKKSVLGRGIIGGLLFGSTGAVLGSLTAFNNIKTKYFLVLTYLSNPSNRPHSIIFNASVIGWKTANKTYVSKLKREIAKIEKSPQVKEYLGISYPKQNQDKINIIQL